MQITPEKVLSLFKVIPSPHFLSNINYSLIWFKVLSLKVANIFEEIILILFLKLEFFNLQAQSFP